MGHASVWCPYARLDPETLRVMLQSLSQPPFGLKFNKIGDYERGYLVTLNDEDRAARLRQAVGAARLSLADSRRRPPFEFGYSCRGNGWYSVRLTEARAEWPQEFASAALRLLALSLSPAEGTAWPGTPGKGPFSNLHTTPNAAVARWLPAPGHGVPDTYIREPEIDDPRSPEFYEWLNYWSPATAAHLGFPDPVRDAEWLSRAEQLENGGWIIQLTPEPLDMEGRPDHVATVRRFLERFPQIGFRDRPGLPPPRRT